MGFCWVAAKICTWMRYTFVTSFGSTAWHTWSKRKVATRRRAKMPLQPGKRLVGKSGIKSSYNVAKNPILDNLLVRTEKSARYDFMWPSPHITLIFSKKQNIQQKKVTYPLMQVIELWMDILQTTANFPSKNLKLPWVTRTTLHFP